MKGSGSASVRKDPVFLVGCPRSGTTLLQSLLAAHPLIASFPESHFFTQAVSWRTWRRALGLASPRANGCLTRFADTIGEPGLRKRIPRRARFLGAYARAFETIMAETTTAWGKKIWLEKTPDHVHCIETIQDHLGTVDFIHLIRNGGEVIASLYEVTHRYPLRWKGAWSLERCTDKWIAAVATSLDYAGKPHHLLVSYDDLVTSCSEALTRICSFLRIEFSEEMLVGHAEAAEAVIGDEPWKDMVMTEVLRPPPKFERLFSRQEQCYVRERIDSLQARVDVTLELVG